MLPEQAMFNVFGWKEVMNVSDGQNAKWNNVYYLLGQNCDSTVIVRVMPEFLVFYTSNTANTKSKLLTKLMLCCFG